MRTGVRLIVMGSVLILANGLAWSDDAEHVPFVVPDGFRVSLYADDDLAHDIYSMTVDAEGRVVVAGRGYVKILHDDNGNRRADRATLFSEEPKEGARGMYFDGPDLVCTGDNALARYRDRNGDGQADGPREVLAELLQRGDHASNGLVKGPDGWFYVACGNDAGVTTRQLTLGSSPVRDPHQGVVFRCSPDGRFREALADGFRNPYDLTFAADGTLLLVDADGERDQYLPWYSPTRLFDVASGTHHGWMLPGWIRSWNRPPWFFDNVERVAELGRGSPTGAVVYQHHQFPEKYRGAMFSACWSLGRVYVIHLAATAASHEGTVEIFLEPSGSTGFAPVALAVGREGELYVAIGGRGTRGGVYRIDFARGAASEQPKRSDLEKVLAADQPLASWSRAQWVPLARRLGKERFVAALLDEGLPETRRVRAIEVLTELHGGVPLKVARQLVSSKHPAIRSRLAWSLGRQWHVGEREHADLLAGLTFDVDPRVKRQAWEALHQPQLFNAVGVPLNGADLREVRPRRVRAAALRVAALMDDAEVPLSWTEQTGQRETELGLIVQLWRKAFRQGLGHDDLPAALDAFSAATSPLARLEAVRLLQQSLGDIRVEPTLPDVHAGYAPNQPLPEVHPLRSVAIGKVSEVFPTGLVELDHELARLLGMLGESDDNLFRRIIPLWTEESPVESDIHYLIVMSRLSGQRSTEVTRRTAFALAGLHGKMRRHGFQTSRFWPQRVGEAFEELMARDPGLSDELLSAESFGVPDHGLFVARMASEDQVNGVRRILRRLDFADASEWTSDLVGLTRVLPEDERRQLLHDAWENVALRESIALVLAESPHRDDRSLLLETLQFGQPSTVLVVSDALSRMPGYGSPEDLLVPMGALRQFEQDPRQGEVTGALDRLLGIWLKQPRNEDSAEGIHTFWTKRLLEKYPELESRLRLQSEELASFQERMADIDWEGGDAARGRRVYEQRACARCHDGNSRLGPELTGVAQRFSREDLFTAILEPNRDVSPAYWITQVVLASGRVVSGQVLYESPEATLVQTDPDSTVRITGDEIVTIRRSPLSPMPAGLLRGASDEELADLYAWLRTNRGRVRETP